MHKQSAVAVEKVMRESLIQRSFDNVTVVMVSFTGFERANFAVDSSENQQKSARNNMGQPTSKPTLDNYDYGSPDRLLSNQYQSSSTKNIHTTNNDIQSQVSLGKRYESTTNVPDYNVSTSYGKMSGIWRAHK